ncbi:hypothetical protein [Cyclobacterium roseum]|uniref:hypothetical protein n=1 Tax=Cyclobacterium roseum TaxID=2666137 RepID=UPI00139180F1|nr:hypothetical protein [Cyclobacterium roseum]
MPTPTSNKDQLSREMYRLLKIFGTASLGLVLLLSFFNEYRASNSGEDPEFAITDAGFLFFKNIRRIDYEVKQLPTVDRYVHEDFDPDSLKSGLQIELIVQKNRNTAVPFLVLKGSLIGKSPLLLQNLDEHKKPKDSLELRQGNRYTHLENATKLRDWLSTDLNSIRAKADEGWVKLFEDEKERKAFLQTFQDFEKITSHN